MKISTSFFLVVFSLLANQIQAQIENKTHKNFIHSAYIVKNKSKELIQDNPIIEFSNQEEHFLTFDDLSLKYANYQLRVIHCQSDWKPSNLSEIEYLNDFNDIPIRESSNSMGTKIPYIHYLIPLPKVRISGNFILQVYLNRNKKDTVLTKRFSVVENELLVAGKITFAKRNEFRLSHQALELGLSYPQNLLLSGEEDLKIVVRRNANAENLIPHLPRPNINAYDRKISYVFFDNENNMAGSNEYRMIDLRSTQQKLNFVANIQALENYTLITTYPETPQGNYSYTQKMDMNGAVVIENYENPENILQADYVWCNFIFKSRKWENEEIYVGILPNSFQLKPNYKMEYDDSRGEYSKKILLKQGIYNYHYLSNNFSNTSLEGNYSQTENHYEILVYFRKPGQRFDSLIGYQKILYP